VIAGKTPVQACFRGVAVGVLLPKPEGMIDRSEISSMAVPKRATTAFER
jgi:hypothetical protein